MQKAIFPLKKLNIVLGPFEGDHSKGEGINAVDCSAGDEIQFPVTAPYDCIVVFVGDDQGLNAVGIESLERVDSPCRKQEVQWMVFQHTDDISMQYVGKEYCKGDICYHTGTFVGQPGACGDHVHIECGFGSCPESYDNLATRVHENIQDCVFVPSDTVIDDSHDIDYINEDQRIFEDEMAALDAMKQELGELKSEFLTALLTGDRYTIELFNNIPFETAILGEKLSTPKYGEFESIEQRLSNSMLSTTGPSLTLRDSIEELYKPHRTNALSAEECDGLEFSAGKYEAAMLSACRYDRNGKDHLKI